MSESVVQQDALIAAVQINEPTVPCLLFVGETAISEADIAREMCNAIPLLHQDNHAPVWRAHWMVRNCQSECERLNIAAEAVPQDNESVRRNVYSCFVEREDCRTPACRMKIAFVTEQNRERFHSPNYRRETYFVERSTR